MSYLSVSFTQKEYKRIHRNIVKKDCWEWLGARDSGGYGQGFYRGKREKIHRLIYASIKGPIPRGLPGGKYQVDKQLDHLCKNKICCNPEHIEIVPQITNNLRSESVGAKSARLTNCPRGHPLVKLKNPGRRKRYCPVCDNLRHKKRIQGPQREYWLEKQRQATARYRAKHK